MTGKMQGEILTNLFMINNKSINSWERKSLHYQCQFVISIFAISVFYCNNYINTNQPLPLPGRDTPPASVTLDTRSVGTT